MTHLIPVQQQNKNIIISFLLLFLKHSKKYNLSEPQEFIFNYSDSQLQISDLQQKCW